MLEYGLFSKHGSLPSAAKLWSSGDCFKWWRKAQHNKRGLPLKEVSGEKAFGLPPLRIARAAQRVCPHNGSTYLPVCGTTQEVSLLECMQTPQIDK